MSRQIAVHPNSTAARKWGRTTWTTTLTDGARAPGARQGSRDRQLRTYFQHAAQHANRGDHDLARRIRAAAMRAHSTSLHCG